LGKLGFSATVGRERPVKSKKKLIVHHGARSLRAHRAYGLRPGGRTLRKEIKKNLCALSGLCGLCGEILIGKASDFMKFHSSAASDQKNGQFNQKKL